MEFPLMPSSSHPAISLYIALTSLGLAVSSDGERLLIAPSGRLNSDTTTLVREFKSDLLTLIEYPPFVDSLRPSTRMCPVCFRLVGWHAIHGDCEGPPLPDSVRRSRCLNPLPMTVRLNEVEDEAA
jgi:hypothetical protein